MEKWTHRPIEEANLLNPAFCCVALTSAVIGYMGIDKEGIPYPLAHIVLPIVLHKATRERLPRASRTSLAVWIQENSEVRVQFVERVVMLKSHTREAILFGFFHDWLILCQEGRIQAKLSKSIIDRLARRLENEAKECINRAWVLGKWFALAGTTETVMALWGIRP